MAARFLFIFVLFSFSLHTSAQQYDWSQYKEGITRIFRTPGLFEVVVDSSGIKGAARQVMIDYLHEIYDDDELLDYFTKSLQQRRTLLLSHKGKGPSQYALFAGEFTWSLASKGIIRLSPEDQWRYFAIEYELINTMSSRDCQKTFEDVEPNIPNIAKFYDAIPQANLKTYLTIFKKAILAEVRNYPKRKLLSKKEVELAESAFANTFAAIVRKDNVHQSIVNAIDNIPGADPDTGCQAGKLILKTVLSMKGRAGELMVKNILEEVNR